MPRPLTGWRSIHRQAGCLPSEVRARHGESATGLAAELKEPNFRQQILD